MSKSKIFKGWFDISNAEIADKCAFRYDPTYFGGRANMKVGARDYLIQQLWENGKGCSINAKSPIMKTLDDEIQPSSKASREPITAKPSMRPSIQPSMLPSS